MINNLNLLNSNHWSVEQPKHGQQLKLAVPTITEQLNDRPKYGQQPITLQRVLPRWQS
jgi:hypothetical protein